MTGWSCNGVDCLRCRMLQQTRQEHVARDRLAILRLWRDPERLHAWAEPFTALAPHEARSLLARLDDVLFEWDDATVGPWWEMILQQVRGQLTWVLSRRATGLSAWSVE
jgi:hypothetical protein